LRLLCYLLNYRLGGTILACLMVKDWLSCSCHDAAVVTMCSDTRQTRQKDKSRYAAESTCILRSCPIAARLFVLDVPTPLTLIAHPVGIEGTSLRTYGSPSLGSRCGWGRNAQLYIASSRETSWSKKTVIVVGYVCAHMRAVSGRNVWSGWKSARFVGGAKITRSLYNGLPRFQVWVIEGWGLTSHAAFSEQGVPARFCTGWAILSICTDV
jgi:hypothetical protein